MGMSEFYGVADWDESVATIKPGAGTSG